MVKFRWEKEFKETEIGEIPKYWEVKKIREALKHRWGMDYERNKNIRR